MISVKGSLSYSPSRANALDLFENFLGWVGRNFYWTRKYIAVMYSKNLVKNLKFNLFFIF